MVFKAKAYAKTNLFLDVIGKRPDGYHDIETVMQSVSIYDTIELELTERGIIIACDNAQLSGEGNIAAKACHIFFELCGYNGGVNLKIEKNIPVAAGMGGGSADAAAVLVLLNKALATDYSLSTLVSLGARLGADVPFFLIGGTAYAEGIGDKLKRIDSPKMYYVFLKELEKQSTGKMYNILDSVDVPKTGNINSLITALNDGNLDIIYDNIFNAFEFCWDFSIMKKTFEPFGPNKIFLSGSGPTVCACFKTKSEAQSCADILKNKGLNCFYAETTRTGLEVV